MPTPFPFVSGAVLTAANLNSISELPTRTLTSSAAAVAADAYSRVILNGTSITYTINTSTFTAGQVVQIYNANSTNATIAAGMGITLNGAGGLTLAQYQTAELYAVSATAFVLSPSGTSGGAFTTFTPTWSNYTRGNGTTEAAYTQIGKLVYMYINETLGSTSSMGTGPTFTLPITASSVNSIAGWGLMLNSGDAYYGVQMWASNTTTVVLDSVNTAGTYAKGGTINATTPFSWGTGDALYLTLTYRAA